MGYHLDIHRTLPVAKVDCVSWSFDTIKAQCRAKSVKVLKKGRKLIKLPGCFYFHNISYCCV